MQQDSIPETQIVTQQVSKEADISGPLNERLLHKNLKARREAYQELHELFENEKDTRGGSFAEYGNNFVVNCLIFNRKIYREDYTRQECTGIRSCTTMYFCICK